MLNQQYAPLFRLLILAAFLLPTVLSAQPYWDDLIPVQREGLWGYLNKEKEVVIQPAFDGVTFFHIYLGEEYLLHARVRKGNHYGIIDQEGEFLLPIRYDSIAPSSVDRSTGGYGTLWLDGQQKFFSLQGEIMDTLPGHIILSCGFGLEENCAAFSMLSNTQQAHALPRYQIVEIDGSKQPQRDSLLVELDSIYRLNEATVFYRHDGKIAIAGTLFNDGQTRQYYYPLDFLYDQIGFFPCPINLANLQFKVIKVRVGDRWRLLPISPSHPQVVGENRLKPQLEPRPSFLQILERTGNYYLVEYAPNQFGYLFANEYRYVEYW